MSEIPVDFRDCGSSALPALVMLHGIGGGARSFEPQFTDLCESRRLLAWNMPGYGETPPLNTMSFDALSDVLLGMLDTAGIEQCDLLGHSIGGMVAQTLVRRFPARVRSLILSATSPAFGRSDGDFQRRFLEARLGPLDAGATMQELADELVDSLVGENPDPAGVALASACMASVPDATYRQAMQCLVQFDERAALGAIAVPTLLIAGEYDGNAPAPMMQKMATYIPDARYVCLPGAGHLANLEQPQRFNAAVRTFLDTGVFV